jgi:hypothetical protein
MCERAARLTPLAGQPEICVDRECLYRTIIEVFQGLVNSDNAKAAGTPGIVDLGDQLRLTLPFELFLGSKHDFVDLLE